MLLWKINYTLAHICNYQRRNSSFSVCYAVWPKVLMLSSLIYVICICIIH